MALRKGLPAKLAATDADDTRYDLGALVVAQSSGAPRGGLTSKTNIALLTGTATMAVQVGAFTAVAVRDNGAVLLANDGVTSVTLDAAPVSNSRIDVIYAMQHDASSTVSVPDADNVPIITFAKGTALAIPTKPSIPAGAVEIGTVTVSSGNTNTNAAVITQTAQYTAGPGGSVPFRTYSDLTGWTAAGTYQHAHVFADSTASLNGDYIFIGGSWLWQGNYEGDLAVTAPWTAGTGVNKPRYRIEGRQVTLFGTVTYVSGSSYADLVTVPAVALPPTMTTNRNLGAAPATLAASMQLFRIALLTTGHIGQITGGTGSLTGAGTFVDLNGLTWRMD